MSTTTVGSHAHDDAHEHGHEHSLSFLRKYVFSLDHKVIGVQFLFSTLLWFMVGGLLALAVRWQLAWPWTEMPIVGPRLFPGEGGQISPEFYTMLFTMHASIMIFFVIIPILAGAFGNFLIPLMIGADDNVGACTGDGFEAGNVGLGSNNGGISKDLGLIKLPEQNPGDRAAAAAVDPSIATNGIPVYMVAMIPPATLGTDPTMQCIATNSGGQALIASNEPGLLAALESIVTFKRSSNVIANAAVPALATGSNDSSQIGAVIPSHKNPSDGSSSQWSIWSGSLKSFKLDNNGSVPTVTATPTVTPGYPDESDPDNATPALRKPVWNASRVLGYTDPGTNLAAKQAAVPAGAGGPQITVWPGRRMIWGRTLATPTIPLKRANFMPTGAGCDPSDSVNCFNDLGSAMGFTTPLSAADQLTVNETVRFFRGGDSNTDSGMGFGRDQVLNQINYGGAGLGVIPLIGPAATQLHAYSYYYQDDVPLPGNPPQLNQPTDGASTPPGYPHKLGDIFHSDAQLLNPPRYYPYLSADLTPRVGQDYGGFALLQQFRRKVVFVGSNDGFLHAFDVGVWNRDAGGTFDSTWDLGTGREIFAYAPKPIMNKSFPALLDFPPKNPPFYFVDGSSTSADVFVDPSPGAGGPTPGNRVWKTELVGSLRQGGQYVYALDVTQPDDITAGGVKVDAKDNSPDCLDGAGSGGVGCPTIYPQIMWEITDDCAVDANCVTSPAPQPPIGQTWSKPVVGRIQVATGANSFDDRYVAIFGGGYDTTFNPGDMILETATALKNATRGRALYIVDVETGKILYKGISGKDDAGTSFDFAPMPAGPAVVDYNDDGYLDVAYIGDVNGRMWRVDLTPDFASGRGVSGSLTYFPFLFYDASKSCTFCIEPIFMTPTVIFVSGGVRPTLGVAFGTGDRANLLATVSSPQRFLYVLDTGATTSPATFHEADLTDVTPGTLATPPVPSHGFFLTFEGNTEKTTSQVFSTQGFLTLVTFAPSTASSCGTEGDSFRYRFFFLTGAGGYGTGNAWADYREDEGTGYTSAGQYQSIGDTAGTTNTHDISLGTAGTWKDIDTLGSVRTILQNWKEQ